MSITPTDLGGETGLALRVFGYARSIAPIQDLPDGTDRDIAIAVLQAIMGEISRRGSRLVKAQATGASSVQYADPASFFSADDRETLRQCCGKAPLGGPLSAFPRGSGPVSHLWPEDGEC